MIEPGLEASHRGCEIHRCADGSFDVYEIGEDPTTAEAYANVPSLSEARLVVNSLFELYSAASIIDALFPRS